MQNEAEKMEKELHRIHSVFRQNRCDEALAMAENLIRRIEQNPVPNEPQTEYLRFNEYFEEVLYRHLYSPVKEIRQLELPYPNAYFLYGCLLVEKGRAGEAKTALEKARCYNPTGFNLAAEYITAVQMTGDMDKFFELTLDAFKIAFRKTHIARCYRNLGFYFIEKELYQAAVVCYILSLLYEQTKKADSQLFFIATVTGETIEAPTESEIVKCAGEYGFPVIPNKDAIELVLECAGECARRNDAEGEKYFKEIFLESAQNCFVHGYLQERMEK